MHPWRLQFVLTTLHYRLKLIGTYIIHKQYDEIGQLAQIVILRTTWINHNREGNPDGTKGAQTAHFAGTVKRIFLIFCVSRFVDY